MIMGKRTNGEIFQVNGGSAADEIKVVQNQTATKHELAEVGIQTAGPVLAVVQGGKCMQPTVTPEGPAYA